MPSFQIVANSPCRADSLTRNVHEISGFECFTQHLQQAGRELYFILLICSNKARTLVLMHLMGELWVLFLFCIIAQCLPVHTGHSRWSKTQQHKKPENRRRGRRVSVSYVQRPCCPLPGSSHFLNLLPCFTNPTCRYFTSWEWHKRQSTISLVLLQTAHTKPTDSTFKFSRKNGQQKCPPEGNVLLFYFEYTSEPALYHCCLSKNTAVVMK